MYAKTEELVKEGQRTELQRIQEEKKITDTIVSHILNTLNVLWSRFIEL